ncbi:MAG: SCO family protein [Thermomonas sp.]
MKRSNPATTVRLALAGIALAACASLALAASPAVKPLPPDSLYQLALPLTDQDGRTADWRSLRGKPRVVSMFYTSCQYICPLIVDSGKAIEHQLSPVERGRIGIVLISMDPARDTQTALRKVFDKRGLDASGWLLASPPPAEVRTVAGLLGIRYRQLADGEFNHGSALILLDTEGRIVARTEQVGSKPDPEFVAAVRRAANGKNIPPP